MTATCQRCPASLVWARTPAGKAMPIEVDTDGNPTRLRSDGNVALRLVNHDGKPYARVLKTDEELAPDEVRTVAHFTDCPGWNR